MFVEWLVASCVVAVLLCIDLKLACEYIEWDYITISLIVFLSIITPIGFVIVVRDFCVELWNRLSV